MEEKMLKFEDVINKLSGVIASKVILDDQQIKEIHVLTNRSRAPKQISRDIQSSLTAYYGTPIDHRMISIAQIEDGSRDKRLERILLSKATYEVEEDNLATATVKLKMFDEEFIGTCKGVNSSRNAMRLVVTATLNCVLGILESERQLVVEDVEITLMAKTRIATVAIALADGYDEQLLVGAAVIRKSENEAIVRATLDAVNRRMCQL
jgi:hypothetical protein